MIRCKQAMEMDGSACGKVCCCLECGERADCKDVCTSISPDCADAISEETALAEMKKDAAAVIKAVADLTIHKKRIEEAEKEMRGKLLAAMEQYGVKKFDTPEVTFTYIAPTTRSTIDSAKLKKELPDVAAKYTKTSNVSASVKIEVKG